MSRGLARGFGRFRPRMGASDGAEDDVIYKKVWICQRSSTVGGPGTALETTGDSRSGTPYPTGGHNWTALGKRERELIRVRLQSTDPKNRFGASPTLVKGVMPLQVSSGPLPTASGRIMRSYCQFLDLGRPGEPSTRRAEGSGREYGSARAWVRTTLRVPPRLETVPRTRSTGSLRTSL